MAAARTVVIVLEDVHWADDLLLDVVEQLLGRSRRRSLAGRLHRPAGVRRAAAGMGRGRERDLVRPRAARRCADAPPAGPRQPGDAGRRAPSASSPRPRATRCSPSTWPRWSATRTHPAALPRSIQVLLTARVEALPEPEREVVSVAAVAGREFPVAAVEALVGRPIGERARPSRAARADRADRRRPAAVRARAPAGGRLRADPEAAPRASCTAAGPLARRGRGERRGRGRPPASAPTCCDPSLARPTSATAQIGAEAGARLAAAGRRADAMGDPRAGDGACSSGRSTLLPETSPGAGRGDGRACRRRLEPAPAGGARSACSSAGADLAAEHGLRALELRARILRIGTLCRRRSGRAHRRARCSPRPTPRCASS